MRLKRPAAVRLLVLLGTSACLWAVPARPAFRSDRAMQDVQQQVLFGARVPGSRAHSQEIAYIQAVLAQAGWQSHLQMTSQQGFAVTNILAVRGTAPARILLGAHYDSRMQADRDQESARSEPVPGANDGASGVAVLLELARSLPAQTVPVLLVFFDGEDNGGLEGRPWVLGSTAFVQGLVDPPECAIIVDMVGDADLRLRREQNSDAQLGDSLWDLAGRLGYTEFVDEPGYSILDDHTPFLQAGIPAVDIIDLDYAYWHTTQDTPDKVSADSLQAVGDTLYQWIVRY